MTCHLTLEFCHSYNPEDLASAPETAVAQGGLLNGLLGDALGWAVQVVSGGRYQTALDILTDLVEELVHSHVCRSWDPLNLVQDSIFHIEFFKWIGVTLYFIQWPAADPPPCPRKCAL